MQAAHRMGDYGRQLGHYKVNWRMDRRAGLPGMGREREVPPRRLKSHSTKCSCRGGEPLLPSNIKYTQGEPLRHPKSVVD